MFSQLLDDRQIRHTSSRHATVDALATATRDAGIAAQVPATSSDRRSVDAVRWAATLLAQLDSQPNR